MADIFGKEQRDYAHLRYLEQAGRLQAAQREWTQARGYPSHDFNALDRFLQGPVWTRTEESAQAFGFVLNNLQAVMAMIDEILYTADRLTEMVPLAMDVPEGAATYSYRVLDRAGEGDFISFDGTDAPSAAVSQYNVPYTLHYAGIVPKWTIEDMRRARMTGLPLDTETIEAAVRGAMNHIERVAFTGDTPRALQGLTNLPVPSIDATPSGNQVYYRSATDQIQSMTAEATINFLQEQTTRVITQTQEVFGRTLMGDLCIYMPLEAAAHVSETRVLDTGMNVWEYFSRNNSWFSYTGRAPMLKWLAELDTAGAVSGGTNDRYIWALKDRRVMELAVPIMPRVLNVENKSYTICAPMEYKISGLNVKRPQAITYIDPS